MSSSEMDTIPAPDKAALVSVLNYLRTKKLKDTEEALKKELSLLGQAEYTDLSAPSLEVSSLGTSGTEPAKYEESYSGFSSCTPSTSTMTDLQSDPTEDTPSRAQTYSRSTVHDDNDLSDEDQLDSHPSTLEVSSGNQLPNLMDISSTRPAHLTLIKPGSPREHPADSPLAESVTSPTLNNGQVLICSTHNRSTSEQSIGSVKSPPVIAQSPQQFTMGSPLLYQVGTARPTINRQIITPILTVLPSTSLMTAAALQAGGQPIIFSTTQASQPQALTNSASLDRKSPSIKSPITPANHLPSPVEPARNSPSASSPPRTLASLMLSEMTPQYLELKTFAEEFKTKRIRLGYTQGAVGQSLAQKGYNNFAQSTISRFEQLQLSPANAAAIKQVLEKWLQEAECPNSQPSSVSSSSSIGPIMNCRKRKKRAVFTAQTRNTLDEFFKQSPRPNRQLIENIASELGLLPEEVRVWFCNKRQKSKQTLGSNASYDRESSVSTSSFVDSPPSFFDKARSPSPKTPFTIEELSKSSVSMTTSPSQSTSPVQLSTLGLVRPLSSTGLYPMVFSLPPSPPRLIHHSPSAVAQTTA